MGWVREGDCFRTQYRVCVDPERIIWIRWFLVPEDAPLFPYPSAFTEGVWESPGWGGVRYEGIGRVGFRPWIRDRGLPPLVIAPFAGEPSWFVDGIPPQFLPP